MAGLQFRHVVWVGREDERAESLRHHGQMGIDHIGGVRRCESPTDRDRLVECVDAVVKVVGKVMADSELMHRGFVVAAEQIQCDRNYASCEMHHGREMWGTRKGAIDASTGKWGIIPGSMATGSFIVSGRGNPDSYRSASHGAGRKLSRAAARKQLLFRYDAVSVTNQVRKDVEDMRLDRDQLSARVNANCSVSNSKSSNATRISRTYRGRPNSRDIQVTNDSGHFRPEDVLGEEVNRVRDLARTNVSGPSAAETSNL